MKTIQDLFAISGEAVMSNNKFNHWFIEYSGHVNKFRARLFEHGWESGREASHIFEDYLNEESIQAAYWFIKSHLKG
jgi:hypothetical protein